MYHNNISKSCNIITACVHFRPRTNSSFSCLRISQAGVVQFSRSYLDSLFYIDMELFGF